MIAAISDTHAMIWYLYKDKRLSPGALAVFTDAEQNGDRIGISVMTLIEIVFLVERQRIPSDAFNDLTQALDNPASILQEISINRDITQVMRTIPHATVPEMPDRIIAATALHLGVPLISRDSKIKLSAVQTIW